MSITINNLVNLDNLLKEGLSDEIENNYNEKTFNLEDLYKDNGKLIILALNSNMENIDPFPIIKSIEIILTLDNFPTYHYDIMKNKYIAYYISDNMSVFVTPEGFVYKTNEDALINLILGVPYPQKLTFDIIPRNQHIISLNLISNIFFNRLNDTLEDLFKSYIHNMDCPSDVNEIYQALVHIYPIVDNSLKKGMFYTDYINLEHKVYMAALSINDADIFNTEKITSRISILEEEIQALCLTLDIDTDYLNAIEELLPILHKRDTSKYISYKAEYNTLAHTDYSKFNKLCYEYIYLVNKIYSTPLNTYNNFGLFDTKYDVPPSITDKNIIKGSYNNIFYISLASLLQNKEFINYCNVCDSDLVNELYKSKVQKNVTPYDVPLLKSYLKAYILGVSDIDDFALYLLEYQSTIVPREDLEALYTIIPIVFGELLSLIDNFNNNPHLGPDNSLIVHLEYSPIYKAIKSKERIIIKNLIADIHSYCLAFNSNNKDKMNIISFDDQGISLACDEEALSVGIDTLSRRMVSNFDKYIRNIKCSCNIDVL